MLLRLIALAAPALIAAVGHAEDIDIFAGANGSAAGNPTVLIVFDNSSNASLPLAGSTKIDTARNALASVVGALTDATGQINVGLLAFARSPAASASDPDAAPDTAYIAFVPRPMSSATHRAGLAAALRSLPVVATGQQAGAPLTLALEEARRYLGGLGVLSGSRANAPADAAAIDAAGTTYVSPLQTGGCQHAMLLVVANGPPSSADSDFGAAALRALRNGSLPSPLALPPPYPAPRLAATQDAASNWLDEFAGMLRRSPFPDSSAALERTTAIVTHTIALHDPASALENASSFSSARALVLNASMQGGGRYGDATDSTSLVAATNAVIVESQASSAIFASASLPASASAAGTFTSQVYMPMFRADGDRPRWSGNLKRYGLAYDSASGVLELIDAQSRPAIDAASGFITPTAQSGWSTPRTSGPILPSGIATVDFFAGAPAGSGVTPGERSADSPDGEIVDKGGAAQRLRARYLGNQGPRPVYTCPPSGCVAGTSLNADPAYRFDNATLTCASHQLAFGLDPSACAAELPLLVDWIRGADNTSPDNEAWPGPGGIGTAPIRPSVHGDVVHSRPLLIDYGASGVVAFYGANDGMLHAVRAGQPASGGGDELWAFIPSEVFSKFKRLRDASPPLQWPSASAGLDSLPPSRPGAAPKDYFVDGTPGHYQVRDAAGNLTATYLFVSARRGGAFIYALDVTNPSSPKFLWRHAAGDGADSAFDDLALTFSSPKAARVSGYPQPVVVFGGGYSGGYDASGAPLGEDADPPLACARTPVAGCGNRIYVLDAATGAIVRSFQQNAGAGGNLTSSVAADPTLVDSQRNGTVDRAYAVDAGGSVWRIDFDARGPAEWKLYKLAQTSNGSQARKFLHAADAVVTRNYTAILVGSGDREKPLKSAASDRFYMFKDRVTAATVAGDSSGFASRWPVDADAAGAGNMADVSNLDATALRQVLASPANNGWFYRLGPGEKVVNAPLTAAGIVYFGTNQPSAAVPGTCTARLGVARAYGLRFDNGAPGRDLDHDGSLDPRDAAVVLAGGGLPPSPVGGMVTLRDVATGADVLVPFVIGAGGVTGGPAGMPSQSAPARVTQQLSKSIRKTYWYQRPAP